MTPVVSWWEKEEKWYKKTGVRWSCDYPGMQNIACDGGLAQFHIRKGRENVNKNIM